MTEFVRLEVDGGVGTIRLDRPPMNAISRAVGDELRSVAAEATARDDVRAVIVYGGEKVFAAGADVKEMASLTYAEMAPIARSVSAGLGALAGIPKPTVAAITGYALGGGLEVVLTCDRRIAADNATLGVPEILLGVIPGGGGTQRLARLVGPARAKDMVFTGRFVRADEALAIGLVDELVPAADVYARAGPTSSRSPTGPRWRTRRRRRRSTAGWTSTCGRGWTSSRTSSRGCSRPTTSASGWRRSSSTGPGRRSSPAGEPTAPGRGDDPCGCRARAGR